ncbi:MAG: response regulator [Chloroflexota bacterium]|nr:response regulator [Chloroflexota bacterium]
MASQPMILVVDDQRSIRELVADILTDEGYHVISSADGQQALDRLQTFDAQLVITDVMMPVLDGWNLTQELRQQEHLRHLPVILMSAANDIPFNPKHLDRHTTFLPKPFEISSLLDSVEASLTSDM